MSNVDDALAEILGKSDNAIDWATNVAIPQVIQDHINVLTLSTIFTGIIAFIIFIVFIVGLYGYFIGRMKYRKAKKNNEDYYDKWYYNYDDDFVIILFVGLIGTIIMVPIFVGLAYDLYSWYTFPDAKILSYIANLKG